MLHPFLQIPKVKVNGSGNTLAYYDFSTWFEIKEVKIFVKEAKDRKE
jgi:hypothetical protein